MNLYPGTRFNMAKSLLVIPLLLSCGFIRIQAKDASIFDLALLRQAQVAVWPLLPQKKDVVPGTNRAELYETFSEKLSGLLVPVCAVGSLTSAEVGEFLTESPPEIRDPAAFIKLSEKKRIAFLEDLRRIPRFRSIRFAILIQSLEIRLDRDANVAYFNREISGVPKQQNQYRAFTGFLSLAVLDLESGRILWKARLVKSATDIKATRAFAMVEEALLRSFLDPILDGVR
jgi:hypothetical protein